MAPSAPEIVHPVPGEQVPEWMRANATTFLRDPRSPDAARRIALLQRGWEPDRAWGARDRGRWVATLRTEPRGLTVPGEADATRELRVDTVTNVTVAATHRRRGLMGRLLGDALAAARERGDPLSILIAAEWPIYGRFGYAPATLSVDYELHRSRAGAAVAGDPGRVRQVEPEELGDVAAGIYAAARRGRAGQVDRDARWWNRLLGRDGYVPSPELPHNWLLHDGDEGPDGLLGWTATGHFGLVPPLATVEVAEFATAGETAYRNLWAYLSGIDGTDRVRVPLRPVDEPVRWLLGDGRTLAVTEQVDFLWLRLIDVAGALSGRRYALPGDVVLEVSDPDPGGYAAGRYRLCADGDGGQCTRTTAAADLEISQRALAAIYLGGFRLGALRIAGGVRERTPGALSHVDLMFSTPAAPWNATWF